jgi:hypothetical protein
MLDPLDAEARLAAHAELMWNIDRHAWMRALARRGRRPRRFRDRVALALFALAAWVDPEVVQAHRRSDAPAGRL